MKLRLALVLSASGLLAAGGLSATGAYNLSDSIAQETFPAPPADRTLIYFADEKNTLMPLAIETGATPLHTEAVATSDKLSYVELKGERAATVITNDEPRFYLFLPDKPDAKPPFLVRLTEKKGARRVSAMAQKGYKGFAIPAEEIIKPHYRILARDGGMQFMEIRMREPLMPGEYAIIGTDLQHIATFRLVTPTNR
ncbi:MAG TPA: hypothetical protein VKB86_02170 [Pyrinomonadaceae bacterium]|nr:hypothetical protein [Pyrinomonadaceae bacterium]